MNFNLDQSNLWVPIYQQNFDKFSLSFKVVMYFYGVLRGSLLGLRAL